MPHNVRCSQVSIETAPPTLLRFELGSVSAAPECIRIPPKFEAAGLTEIWGEGTVRRAGFDSA